MNNLFRFSVSSNDVELRTVVATDQKSASDKVKILFPKTYTFLHVAKKEKFDLP